MFYNKWWQKYHGIAENYHGKKFYNIGPLRQNVAPDLSYFKMLINILD